MDDEEAMVGAGAGTGTGGAPNENEGDDADLNLPPRPEPPADFDEESIRQQITDKFLKIRSRPFFAANQNLSCLSFFRVGKFRNFVRESFLAVFFCVV